MSQLLTVLGVDPDFGTIVPRYRSHSLGSIKSLEAVGDPQILENPGTSDGAVFLSQKAPAGANAYMIGSYSDPHRGRGSKEYFRRYGVQYYKIEMKPN